jgi:hypothetical protein
MMDLEHAQSLDFSLRKAVAPARPRHAADRVAANASRALKVAEWLRAEGHQVISLYVNADRPPEILLALSDALMRLAEAGHAECVLRQVRAGREYHHWEQQRLGCRVFWIHNY